MRRVHVKNKRTRGESSEVQHSSADACMCAECRHRRPFTFPDSLLDDCRAGRLVFFAGAGISTERDDVLPRTFYANICADLGLDPATAGPFPDVMSAFVAQPNGRRGLLNRLRERLAYIESFEEIRNAATRFHRELSTLHLADVIITTNWDDYFERECGATPFVTAEDFTFWEVPGRKVFKLHGSVNGYGSLVATRSDYDACYERLSAGLLGSTLRLMLATKTIVYIGFSFRDEDLLRLHTLLTQEMKGLRPQSYIVTLDRASDERFRQHGLIPIYTDGTFFIKSLKAQLVKEGSMLPDTVYNGLRTLISRLTRAHLAVARIDVRQYPEVIYTLFYQDGLRHALERILTMRATGYYSHLCNPRNLVLSYEGRRKMAIRDRRFTEAAYLDGYMNGNVAFLAGPAMRRSVPFYFLHGHDGYYASLDAFKRILRRAPQLHRGASRVARKIVSERIGTENLVPHHPPWL